MIPWIVRKETPAMQDFRQQVESELLSDILPFWLKYTIDEEHGGFHGQIANDLTIDPRADKGIILNARILWTFSRAYRAYRDPVYRPACLRIPDLLLLGPGVWRRLLDARC
jgi:mannobiose 2-epimerase